MLEVGVVKLVCVQIDSSSVLLSLITAAFLLFLIVVTDLNRAGAYVSLILIIESPLVH